MRSVWRSLKALSHDDIELARVGGQLQPQHVVHLPVPVLVDDIDAVMRREERRDARTDPSARRALVYSNTAAPRNAPTNPPTTGTFPVTFCGSEPTGTYTVREKAGSQPAGWSTISQLVYGGGRVGLEIPIAERIAAIRARKAEDRTEIYYRMNDVAPLLVGDSVRGAMVVWRMHGRTAG